MWGGRGGVVLGWPGPQIPPCKRHASLQCRPAGCNTGAWWYAGERLWRTKHGSVKVQPRAQLPDCTYNQLHWAGCGCMRSEVPRIAAHAHRDVHVWGALLTCMRPWIWILKSEKKLPNRKADSGHCWYTDRRAHEPSSAHVVRGWNTNVLKDCRTSLRMRTRTCACGAHR